MPSFFSISQMATTHKVSFRALRFYEQQGLLAPSRNGSQRVYTAKDSIRLQLILKGKQLGFTLSELKKILAQTDQSAETTKSSGLLLNIHQDDIAKRIEALSKKGRDAVRD